MTVISTTSKNEEFSIEVLDETALENQIPSPHSQAVGRIRVGDFTEIFPMDLSYWSVNEYRTSWCRALTELEQADTTTSCLISSITDPERSNFISCWPMYREWGAVYVQNSIILLDELDEAFDPQEPWRYVQPRCSVDEDGNRVSEWVTSWLQVRRFRDSAWSL